MKKILVLFAFLMAAMISLADTLSIGYPAPALKAHWLKGTPIDKMEKGHVYVLEFWATWCGPCVDAMPHVTRLARQYEGKASFVGVNVFERSAEGSAKIERVEKFVKEHNEKMGYAVCMDDDDAFMSKNWVKAAGIMGIPATIIIDKAGMIAWIGHPNAMDKPLAEIINGSWDNKAFAIIYREQKKNEARQIEESNKVMAATGVMEELLKAKNYTAVLDSFAVFSKQMPEKNEFLAPPYFKALARYNAERAIKELDLLKDSLTRSAVLSVMASDEGLDKKFYYYVIDNYAGKSYHPFIMGSISAAYFNAGDFEKAVEMQQKWVDWCKAEQDSPPPLWYLRMEEERLKKYKQALNK